MPDRLGDMIGPQDVHTDTDEESPGRLALAGRFFAFAAFVYLLWPVDGQMPDVRQRLLAVTVLMAVLWATQAIHISATSLIPLVAFPLLGIQTAKDVSNAYINENIFLYLGGFIIALGIEKWNLHRRIALLVIRLIGTSPRQLLMGFMSATAFLSMWISNTASTLLMLPIGLAMLTTLDDSPFGDRSDNGPNPLGANLMIGIAWAASIGGMSTLVGTPTNLSFSGIWVESFPNAPEMSAGPWMMNALPVCLVMLTIAWLTLGFGMKSTDTGSQTRDNYIRDQLASLGKPGRAELWMLVIFFATAVLWIFRKPLQFGAEPILPGWGPVVSNMLLGWGVDEQLATKAVHDSTVAMAMSLLMFFIPADKTRDGKTRYLMDWKTVEGLPWGVLLLIGGGFALAGAFASTGLSQWIGQGVTERLSGMPTWSIVGSLCLLMTFLTEFTSNIATVNTVMPILASVQLDVDPRLIMIPATLSTSCAFMLPIATPPNAIVFASGRIPMRRMIMLGFMLNLIGVVVITIGGLLLLGPTMGIDPQIVPDFAK
jgi:sodium-dependent dicarboxylate transporter 2/3/5